ncbi:hypothetical protein PPL_09203 [Heterostelium album PN500]|uniref:Ras guanine nucleotide exchange factor glfB-like C-terminal domain-containing protein n=1 Tax=Heterostelium pallidum (strain ATCC 26659 / Pp 5 / PN500) TaxID=670386 RepID=D3BKX1_HETP5|nr:hypothetical protein PPL_09203 [Heterostelium album PN500]EFA78551.1 hypothetical protein PPL_09203 [Heterostelium album PN500]|eukprot:XP_020430675.1 hypothetical protein PPL_09203 [Heterostelium album PN500]
MGGCFSKQSKKRVVDQQVSTNGGSNESLETKKKLNDDHKNNLNQVAINWKSNTVGIWKRTHDKLAIHTDVPRLGHKIDIVDKLHRRANLTFQSVTSITLNNLNAGESPTYINGALAGESTGEQLANRISSGSDGATNQQQSPNATGSTGSPSVATINNSDKFTSSTTLTSSGITTAQVLKKEEVVLQVLLSLAGLLDGPEKEQQIKEQYSDHIKGVGDISQQLLSLLTNVVLEQSRMMQLLKVCHQKIILPAYYFIKANLFEDMPFRDKRGSWRMKIVFEEDGTVTAVHSKRQQSTSGTEADPEFEFEWALSISFDHDMQISSLKVDVVDLIISKTLPQDKHQEIQQAFSTLQLATTASNSSGNSFKVSEPTPLNKIDAI